MTRTTAQNRGYQPCATCGGKGEFRHLLSGSMAVPELTGVDQMSRNAQPMMSVSTRSYTQALQPVDETFAPQSERGVTPLRSNLNATEQRNEVLQGGDTAASGHENTAPTMSREMILDELEIAFDSQENVYICDDGRTFRNLSDAISHSNRG